MVLGSGTRISCYEILSSIGAGGMGEVYRARDLKLARDVAIKILPASFAQDAERMARFEREARLLASLNHPNIAAIYGFEDSGSTHALVMELVDGPTLADRIRRGPVALDEALRIARQIAEGLEYAHERGIVHRDLKPANVKIAADDSVKILDFGLAKAVQGEASVTEIGDSPTISQMATQSGVLLGTAAYMSPEQAKGKPVDRRADIWAFGCVLFEMLTGTTAFRGETVTDTLAAIVTRDPDWSLLPAAIPPHIRVLLGRCLRKDPKQRLRDIGDARISLDEVLSGASDGVASPVAASRGMKWWLAAAIAIGFAAVAGFVGWTLRRAPIDTKPVTRFTINLPPGQHLAGLEREALALSADGQQLAYVAAQQNGSQQIYLREMDSAQTVPLPGTIGATNPFFSPDGQWIGFFADGYVKKVPVHGGMVQSLYGAVPMFGGASWGTQGSIAFAEPLSVVQELPETGGAPHPVTSLQSESGHVWPQFLPGDKSVLFLSAALPPSIAVQRIGSGKPRTLIAQIPSGTEPHYVPPGWLLYSQSGILMAMPFDPVHLQVKGQPTAVVQGLVQGRALFGAAQYSVSDTGTLVYAASKGGSQGLQNEVVWVTRNGIEKPVPIPAGNYDQPRVSPDGHKIAFDVTESSGSQQVGIYDIARDTLSRLTFDGTTNIYPVWTPDGTRIAFMSNRTGPLRLFWQLSDGSGGVERLSTDKTTVPFSWSPDGKFLALIEVVPPSSPEMMIMRVNDRVISPFLSTHTGTFEDAPQFSPDGHWIAYASDESGRREIYVQPYPGPGGKWQISDGGGNEPMWNPSGREIFYRNGDKMMAADVSTSSGFAAGKPHQLFAGPYLQNPQAYARANYDVSPDGERFLMIKPTDQEQPEPTEIHVILNWVEELNRLVASSPKN